jgi:iron complex outermembrane receptor protein
MHKHSIIRTTLLTGVSVICSITAISAHAQSASEEPEASSIVVTGQRQAYVGDMPIRDIPQNVQSIDASALQANGITKLENALDLVSGISHQNNFGGLWDSFAIRGFAGDASNLPTGFLVNGFNGGRGFSGPRDTSSVERIDVLKGPTSALFGRGEPGGTVNIITKKPEFTEKGYVQAQAGSWNAYRIEADFTTPLSDTLAVRLNGAYDEADSFRDTVHTKKIFITPSLLWKFADDTSVSYELEFNSMEIPFDRGIPIRNNDFDALPPSRYLGEPDDGLMKIDVLGHQLQLQHDFNSDWSFLAGASYRTTHLRGIGEYPELVASRQPYLQGSSIVSRQRRWADSQSESFIARAEITGHYEVFGLKNTLVVGTDYDWFYLDQKQTRFRPPAYNSSRTLAEINGIDAFNPVYGAYDPVNPYASIVYDRTERDNSWGAYFYNQIDLTEWLKVRVGGRYDEFRQSVTNHVNSRVTRQTVTAFSPQGGVVVQPTDTISLYASYGKGFRPNSGQDFFGRTFEPERSKSYEVGAKYTSPDQRITASVALYDMRKTNILTADPNPEHSGFVLAVGSARSKGVEFDLNAKLPYDFNLMVAYAYTDAYWTSAVRDADFSQQILAGDPLLNVAKNSGNVMLTKDFAIGGERTATLGAGVQYIGKRLGETATQYYLPDVTLVRVIGSVDVADNITVSGNVDNLFNKRWFANSYSALWTFPGSPRSFSVRAQYRF